MEEEPWQSPKRRPHALCLEDLLEEQLEEHRNSRADVDSALLQSPLDPDLQQLRDELEGLIAEAEEALVEIKKARLLESVALLQNCQTEDAVQRGENEHNTHEEHQLHVDGVHMVKSSEEEEEGAMFVKGANQDARDAVISAAEKGQQTDTKLFASWESHGRGVASRLMARMGYIQGKGLGRDKQGSADTLVPRSKPGKGAQRQGLGLDPDQGVSREANSTRTGRQQTARRKRKAAEELARDADHQCEMMTGDKGLFQVINKATGDESDAAKVIRYTVAANSVRMPSSSTIGGGESTDLCRRNVVEHQDRVNTCKKKVADLKKMLKRNQDKKELCESLKEILRQAEADVSAAQDVSTSLMEEMSKKDSLKKWVKF